MPLLYCKTCNVKRRDKKFCDECGSALTPDTSLDALHADLLKKRSAAIAILDKLEVIPTAAGAPLIELGPKEVKLKAAKEAEAIKFGTWAVELKSLMDRGAGKDEDEADEPEDDGDIESEGMILNAEPLMVKGAKRP
jgi:hypothetical protein